MGTMYLPTAFVNSVLDPKPLSANVNVYSSEQMESERRERNIAMLNSFERKHTRKQWELNPVRPLKEKSEQGKRDSKLYYEGLQAEKASRVKLQEELHEKKRKSEQFDQLMDKAAKQDSKMTERGYQYDTEKCRYVPKKVHDNNDNSGNKKGKRRM